MAVTIKQSEAVPATYPAAPTLSGAAATLDPAMLWQRIESYVAWRWTPRQVAWVAEGEGEWVPPLAPATVTASEVWESGAWVAVTLPASPLGGLCLPGDGPYRITADVGAGAPPAAVAEAFRRLAEYLSATDDKPGAASYELDLGPIKESYDRAPTWIARALVNSGAADLLRPFRKVA